MPTLNHQNSTLKLVSVIKSLPGTTVFHSQSDPDGHWAVYMNATENSSGWASLKILVGAVTPADGDNPQVQMRYLALSPRDELIFTLSPVARGVDPDHVAACVEIQSMVHFRRSGLGGLLN